MVAEGSGGGSAGPTRAERVRGRARDAAPEFVLSAGRRARPVAMALGRAGAEARRRAGLAALPVRALPASAARRDRRRRLAAAADALPAAGSCPKVTLICSTEVSVDLDDVEVRVVGPASGEDLVVAWSRAAASAGGEVLVFLAPTSAPIEPGWAARLARAVADAAPVGGRTVGAAVPLSVHPTRPAARATPVDGVVRELGLVVEIGADGAPLARPWRAGADPAALLAEAHGATVLVDAGSSVCVAVARRVFEAVGGFGAIDDPDAAMVDLTFRLGRAGLAVLAVPEALVADDRPFRSAREITEVSGALASGGPAWREVVDRHGCTLVRVARRAHRVAVDDAVADADEPLRVVFTVSATSARVAARWGDTHLAEDLASALRRLGLDAWVSTLDTADSERTRSADVHVAVHGLGAVRRTPGQRHVLWVISHPELVTDVACDAADLVLVASERFAAELRARTSTPVEVLLQATDTSRFRPEAADPALAHPVLVVAKTRDVLRPVVADAVAVGARPAIYGSGWDRFGLGDLVVADHLDNALLPGAYASAGVVLNDHWSEMGASGFVSNRLFDVLACGTPVISDALPELAGLFDGAVLEYRDRAELADLLRDVTSDTTSARARAALGRAAVLARHTTDHRASELLDALSRNGLDGCP